MGVFGAVFGCRGDAGFSGPLLGVSSGVGGFNVATLSRLVREKVLPAWSDVCVSAKKFALRAQNGPKLVFSGVLGEVFRGRADEGAVLGEFFRGNVAEGAVPGQVFRGPAVARERRRQARKPPHLQGYDRGGTPKDPASHCVRWPCRQRQKLSARASARKQRPRSNQARTLSSSTSP